MDQLAVYRPGIMPVNHLPVTGRTLAQARNRLNPIGRGYLAVDIRTNGLCELTWSQSITLAGASPTYAYWANKRMAERGPIEAGFLPLVPPRATKPKPSLSDLELYDFVRFNGLERVFDAVCALEAAQ